MPSNNQPHRPGPPSAAAPPQPVADPGTADLLRTALRDAGFTADGCLDVLGADAYAALSRNETVPALRATRTGSALDGLIRLFLLQQPVAREQVADVLPLDACLRDGWLTTHRPAGARPLAHDSSGAPDGPGGPDGPDGAPSAVPDDAVRATVDIRPYGDADEDDDGWIVSDLGCAVGGAGGIGSAPGAGGGPGVPSADLVLGVGGASTTLAGVTVPHTARSVLDLGTGSGVQALHAARHAAAVTATDLNPRALRFAALTLALSGVPAERAELLHGSLFEPVGERRFDLIVSNPPFVISPGGRFTYRDGGLPGDELCRRLVAEAPAHLTDGGWCQLLANWQHVRGEDWRERLASWIAPTGCDAWVIQRDVQDPARYAELWLRDGGDHRAGPDAYARRYEAWLEAFERDGVEGVGFGWITLRASGEREPVVRIEEWPHPVEQPLGTEIADWFARQDFLRAHDDAALLSCRLHLADGVVQEQIGPPGAEDPETVVLRQQRGTMRATRVGTVGAGFAGACDGSLEAGAILDAIARIVGEDAAVLRERTPENIRLLVEQGFLVPDPSDVPARPGVPDRRGARDRSDVRDPSG